MALETTDGAAISERLRRWAEARQRGEAASAEELCGDCPELAPVLALRIQEVNHCDRLAPSGPGSSGTSRPVDTGGETRLLAPTPSSVDISMTLCDLSFHERGGLGEIYKARHRELPRAVALKFVTEGPERDPMILRRFLREAQITARLENPGIVPVHGLGRDASGRLCYAMRFIDDITLKRAIAEYHNGRKSARTWKPLRRDLAFRALLQRFKSACATVAYAHHEGFLHRDLKPEHIMLGPFEETLVVDWGLARPIARDGQLSAPESAGVDILQADLAATSVDQETQGGIGTPGFASPEQQAGDWQRVGPASNIFSLGATLHVLLTGMCPFADKSVAAVIARVENHKLVARLELNPVVPRELAAICLKALAHRPEDRYATATALADDLEAWLSDNPVTAVRDSWRGRLRRWTARHPKLFVGTVATLLVGFAGLLGMGWLAHRASLRDLLRYEESLRHQEQLRDVQYANAEKTAREIVVERRPGWVERGLGKIEEASRIESLLRSNESLRSLAADCLGGIDLVRRTKLTPINSACVAFSPDGRQLAIGEHHGIPDFHVEVYDVQSRVMIARLTIRADSFSMKRTGVSALAFSPDGRWLAGGFRNGEIAAWEIASLRSAPTVLGRHKTPCRGLVFSPDASTLASGSSDGQVKLWDVNTKWKTTRTIEAHDAFSSLAISPDGRLLALGCDTCGQIIEMNSLKNDTAEPRFVYKRDDRHHQFQFHPDDRTIVAVDWANVINVADARNTSKFTAIVDPDLNKSHSDEISAIVFHRGGSILVSGSNDNSIKVWDLASNKLVLTLPMFTESLVALAFRPGGSTLAIATSAGTTLHDMLGVETMTTSRQHEVVRAFTFVSAKDDLRGELGTTTLEVQDHPNRERHGVIALGEVDAVAPDRTIEFKSPNRADSTALAFEAHPVRRLLAHNGDYRISLYDVDRGGKVGERRESRSSALAFSRGGERLWGVIDESKVVSWSIPELEPETSWEYDPRIEIEGRVGLSSLAAGTKWVVVGSRARRAHVLRAVDGKLARTVRVSEPVRCITINPTDDLVACGLVSGIVALFRPESSERVIEIAAHHDMVNSVAFSPDGQFLATGGRDKTVAIWSTGETTPRQLLRVRSASGRPVLAVKFNPDGRILGILFRNESAVRLLHLDKLRERLGEIGLDWEEDAAAGLPRNSTNR
jgi:eukaryotic-like serine/threonine-protein kinase